MYAYNMTIKRPLAAFRDGAIFTSTHSKKSLGRVDFTPESIAAFEGDWENNRKHGRAKDKKGHTIRPGRSDFSLLRLHEDSNNATWMADNVFGITDRWPRIGAGRSLKVDQAKRLTAGLANVYVSHLYSNTGIGAVVLAGDTVFVAGTEGRLLAYAAADGKKLAERDLPPIVWDGMAAAHGRLYVSTADGKVMALGRK